MEEHPLIPGLPDEIARECLLRVSFSGFSTVRSVSQLWRREIASSTFHRLRRSTGLTQIVIVMAQAATSINPPTSNNNHKPHSSTTTSPVSFRLTLYDPTTAHWSTLPPNPGLKHGLPLFCQIAAAGRSLVVVGGWDPVSWEASDQVFVFDFVSATWRMGDNMPGPRRSLFACASDSVRTLFVAGGHDDEKNALRSALAYDVVGDRWVTLPDMKEERDECKGVFSDGRFGVLGGYSTEFQGQFGKSSEGFEAAKWEWGPVDRETLEVGTCPRTCVAVMAAGDQRLYRCREGWIEATMESEAMECWETVVEVPEEVKVATWMVAMENGSLIAVGSAHHGGAHQAFELDVERESWTKLDVPKEFSGHVQTGCCLCI